ncbi:hypothetical protein P3S67_007387 [Capsicum chacoense]
MPLLFSSSSYNISFFLFFVIIIIYFPNHPCIARKSQSNKAALEEVYFSTDSSRGQNGPKGIANRSIQDFHKEKNENKVPFSDREMIESESSPLSLPHARLLKAKKIKGAERPVTHEIHVAFQIGNKKSLSEDIIEMDYDPPHRKSPIHN